MSFLRTTRARTLGVLAIAAPALSLGACTDLTVDPYSQIPADQFFQTEEEVNAALAPIYAQLRDALTNVNFHALSQVSSDENIIPTRGTDWGDQGEPLQIHLHTWTAQHSWLNATWNGASTGIARANGVLAALETADVPNKETTVAEVRALRAFYYYLLLDLFGRAPLIGDEEGEFLPDPNDPPPAETRQAVFEFVVAELEDVRDQLPAQQAQTGRFGSDVVSALLANLYLNAEVYGGEVTASGLQRGASRWDEAFSYADGLITSGRYSLADDYFSVFAVNNQDNPEHIMVVQHLNDQGLGVSFVNRALHYNSTNVGAWNGFSTLAETYQAFDGDPRQAAFLQGPQDNLITGEPALDRQMNRLDFTLDFEKRTNPSTEDIFDAADYAGVRPYKFPADPDETNGNHSNDYPFFRLGEMYLIRAEAAFELGRTGEALADINAIRTRAGADRLDAVTREDILRERLLELNWEARRRQDLIRADESVSFGTGSGNLFTRGWQYKTQSDPFRVVFPIPQQQINANPMLSQNAGY